MTKAKKLRICNISLLVLTIVMLASGLQLEINPAGMRIWVWLHIAVGILFSIDILWHLILNRLPKTAKKRRIRHPWLLAFFLLAIITGVIASCHWVGTYSHSSIGGVHGKLGFLMIIAVAVHIWKHKNYYKRKKRLDK